jgi:hypothetical protein
MVKSRYGGLIMPQDSTQNLTASLQPSWLAQKLQQRVVDPIGVINVQQWPIAKTHTTIHRMVEREHLPTQIESRYRTVGQISTLELPSRSRVERIEPTAFQYHAEPKLQRSGISTLDSPLAPPMAAEAVISAAASKVAVSVLPSSFRVSRKPSPNPIVSANTELNHQNSNTVHPDPQISTASSPSTLSTPTASPELMRVQQAHKASLMRQPDAEPPVVMAKPLVMTEPLVMAEPQVTAISTPSPDSISLPQATLQRHIDPLAPVSPSAPISPITIGGAAPLIIARSANGTSSANVQQSAQPIPPPSALDINNGRPDPVPTFQNEVKSQNLVQLKADLVLHNSLPIPAGATDIPRVQAKSEPISYPPPPLIPTMSTSRTIIQPLAQSLPDPGGNSILRRSPSLEPSTNLALPLLKQLPAQTIVRQVEPTAQPESLPSLAIPAPPPPAEKTTETTADIKQIAEQVSRLLTQQLTIERERRGIQRW